MFGTLKSSGVFGCRQSAREKRRVFINYQLSIIIIRKHGPGRQLEIKEAVQEKEWTIETGGWMMMRDVCTRSAEPGIVGKKLVVRGREVDPLRGVDVLQQIVSHETGVDVLPVDHRRLHRPCCRQRERERRRRRVTECGEWRSKQRRRRRSVLLLSN